MNVVDLVLLVAMLVFALTGWRKGFVYGLLSLVGFLCGAAVGLFIAPKLVGSWEDGLPKALTALVVVFFLAMLGQVLTGMVGRRLNAVVTLRPAVLLNQAAGAVLSVMSLLLVAWFAADIFAGASSSSLARDVRKSQVLGVVDNIIPMDASMATGQLQSMFDNSGFPEVFAGFGPEPVQSIAPPDAAIARRPGVVDSSAETVKIIGNAPGCDHSLEGSGFAFAPNRVLTNAHVVAGVRAPRVVAGGTGTAYDATVVYFDPDMDLAVLAVPGLPVDPLQFSLKVEAAQSVAVIGYPEDGPLTVTPGRVRGVQPALGSDIYRDGHVLREIISMRAQVLPGNSGGPVVDKDGKVIGVVFASAIDSDNTGYAMTAKQVAPAVTEGVSAVDEVGTGPCT
ncbi:MAG TPA: MarP family serine protease [Actinomycetes bacterium]|nr:MarP family serine protease [Actinomycetes bacterium]